MSLCKGDNTAIITRRISDLEKMSKRQRDELSNLANRGNVLKKVLEEKETLLEKQKETMIIGQEAIDIITNRKEQAELERDTTEENEKEQESMCDAQEKELKEIQSLLGIKESDKGNDGKPVEKRKTALESVFSKQSNERATEELHRREDEKRETLHKLMKAMNEVREKLVRERNLVRECKEAVLRKTNELVSVDQLILETMESVRTFKQEIRKNELDLFDLQQQLLETEDELQRTRNFGIVNRVAFKISMWRVDSDQSSKSKVSKLLDSATVKVTDALTKGFVNYYNKGGQKKKHQTPGACVCIRC